MNVEPSGTWDEDHMYYSIPYVHTVELRSTSTRVLGVPVSGTGVSHTSPWVQYQGTILVPGYL